jgi:SAM-dependent methyltransferase
MYRSACLPPRLRHATLRGVEHMPPEVFGEDYLHFYESFLTDELSETQAGRIWRLLGLEAGVEVLDVPCGHGRIANRLAERGARVTGLDADTVFLERARADAAERGVAVEYVQGDMRALPWEERFDLVLNWFTSFGYFDDDGNRAWLREARKVLRPGGRLVLDLWNRDAMTGIWQPVTMSERDGDLLVDRHEFDALAGRAATERFLVRDGRVRTVHFSVRVFTFTELRDWLLEAGFSVVDATGHEGEPLDLRVRRMLVVATR